METKMDIEAMLGNLSERIPCLRHIFHSEYVPYLTTTVAVLMGWLVVSWIFHLISVLLAPLVVSTIAIALICPATSKRCFQQLGANLEMIVNDFVRRFQVPR